MSNLLQSPKLLKLHGSANWGICTECQDKIIVLDDDRRNNVQELMNIKCEQCATRSIDPYIVPPTWNKGGYQKFIDPVWREALNVLISAGRIFVIGYSFPDSDKYFQYMLGITMALNKDLLEVILVDLNLNVIGKFQNLFEESFKNRYVHGRNESILNFVWDSGLQDTMRTDIPLSDVQGLT